MKVVLMEAKNYLDLYSEEYHQSHLHWALAGSRIFRHYAKEYLELVQPHSGERILELGCSSGKTTRMLIEAGSEVLAVDFDPKAIALAQWWTSQSQQKGNVEILCSSADNPEIYHSRIYDKVTMLDFVEHVPDELLKKILSALRDQNFQGEVYVYTPDRRHFTERLRNIGVMSQDKTHINLKSTPEWLAFFENQGLKAIHVRRATSHWPGLQVIENWISGWPYLGPWFTRSTAIKLKFTHTISKNL